MAPAATVAAAGPQLIVLSARDEERLGENARRLAAHLRQHDDIDLADVACTLQGGREAMAQRAAWLADDREQALAVLDALAAGDDAPGLLRARVEPHQRVRSLSAEQRGEHRALFAAGDLAALAQRWLGGEEPDWELLHGERRPPRPLLLPNYSFARDRHWVSDAQVGQSPIARVATPQGETAAALHPLLSHNVSTLRETGFLSHLSGEAFYGRDHRVRGEPFFPGAGFVELACIAGTLAGERSVARIEDIVWAQPLKLGAAPRPVKTVLRASGRGTDCAVVSFDEHGERVLHCEARLFHETGPAHAQTRPPALPVGELIAAAAHTLDGAQCYERLRRFGFDYGPSFRGVRTLYQGAGHALSKVSLAPSLRAGFDQYLLHPCLIDAALQTVLGVAGEGGEDVPYLPFALDSIQRWRPLAPECYAYAEPSRGAPAGGDVRRFDLRLLSLGGEVLVELNGFYVRALRAGAAQVGAVQAGAAEAVDA